IRGTFTLPATTRDAVHQWQLESDQSAQYFEDRCEIADERIGSTTLYDDYRQWAREQGIMHTLAQRTLVRRLVTRYKLGRWSDGVHRYLGGARLRLTGPTATVVAFRSRAED